MRLFYTSLLSLFLCVMTGCGQSGKLFLPGQGSGYYRTHYFDGSPKKATKPSKYPTI